MPIIVVKLMHVLFIILTGILMLVMFMLFGRLWGSDTSDIIISIKFFIPVWGVVAIINMCIGVFKAGYSAREELPILLIVAAIPVCIALALIWRLGR